MLMSGICTLRKEVKLRWVMDGCRYEYEEHPGVCAALEHAGEYFLSYSKIAPPPGADQLEPAGPAQPQPEGQQEAASNEASKEQQAAAG
jgi:hypothetical protein